MIAYPSINPIALSIGPLQIKWYGLMYLLGFTLAFGIARWRNQRYHLRWTTEQISDLIFFAGVGVILGGRIGYMLFYQFERFLQTPLSLFKLWEGGMSFHGGLIGVFIGLIYFARKTHKTLLEILDFTAPLVPLGLAAGRLGNFINSELWGQITDVPWAMIFPYSDGYPRHPSQLYELSLEGIALFIVIWWYADKPRPVGKVSALFLIGYAIARIFSEFWREPDPQRGYLAFGWLTEGQLLSLPMLVIGLLLWWSKRNANLPTTS